MKLQCPECGSDVDLRLIFTGVVELNQYLNECTGHTSRVIPVIIAWHCGSCKAFGEVLDEGESRIVASLRIKLWLPKKITLVVEEVTEEGAELTT